MGKPLRPAAAWLIVCGAALAAGGATAPAGPSGPDDSVDEALLLRPGAALRHALDAHEAGELERAERLLAALAERHPVVGDVADLHRLELYVRSGRDADARALVAGWRHPDSPLRDRIYGALGQSLADAGDEAAARAAWEQALAASEDGARRAEFELEIGRSQLRSGDIAAAARAFLEVWMRAPLSEAEPRAAESLERLEAEAGKRWRDAEAYRKRGDVLFRAYRNEEALEAYDRALALPGLGASARRRVAQQRAHALFRLRRYPDAARAFGALRPEPSHRIEQARALARSGRASEAARALEAIGSEVRGSVGARARLLAALLWEGEGEHARARDLFRGLADSRSSFGAAALWRLGWDAYREGRNGEALARFEALEARDGDVFDRMRASYWRARAAERVGRGDSAEHFAALARDYPFSYYGWRAARRVEGVEPAEPEPAERGEPSLGPAELARPRILLEAGLLAETRDALDRLRRRGQSLGDRLALAALYADAGAYHSAQRLIVDAYNETLARGPGAGPIEMWWHAWPAPYRDAVGAAVARHEGLDPALVYAIMREESGYRAEVLSVSGARGLLQLMPETAGQLARRDALPSFDPDDLFDPDINIRLGSLYLDELLRRFPGRISAAIGSYNAGPHRVVNWLEHAEEDDEWVEAIPFEETRGYVKRVLRSMHAYRVLY